MIASGIWIALEGGEGTGKTTQTALLAERLRSTGKTVWTSRMPGGTAIGRELREVLVRHAGSMDDFAEELVHAADQAVLYAELMERLARGEWVVTDRSQITSFIYSTIGKGNPKQWEWLFQESMRNRLPDLAIILNLDVREGRKRAAASRAKDTIAAYDDADLEFYTKIRDGFIDYAAVHPHSTQVLTFSAGAPVDIVADGIWEIVRRRLDMCPILEYKDSTTST
jgi:dTMP kinase